jgi:hypothetical protein
MAGHPGAARAGARAGAMDWSSYGSCACGEAGAVSIKGRSNERVRRRAAWVHLSPALRRTQRWATRPETQIELTGVEGLNPEF